MKALYSQGCLDVHLSTWFIHCAKGVQIQELRSDGNENIRYSPDESMDIDSTLRHGLETEYSDGGSDCIKVVFNRGMISRGQYWGWEMA